jgi:hypothetical protein
LKSKYNLKKSKILVFKKVSLKLDERWTVSDKPIDVVNEMNYLGVTLENIANWNKEKLG